MSSSSHHRPVSLNPANEASRGFWTAAGTTRTSMGSQKCQVSAVLQERRGSTHKQPQLTPTRDMPWDQLIEPDRSSKVVTDADAGDSLKTGRAHLTFSFLHFGPCARPPSMQSNV